MMGPSGEWVVWGRGSAERRPRVRIPGAKLSRAGRERASRMMPDRVARPGVHEAASVIVVIRALLWRGCCPAAATARCAARCGRRAKCAASGTEARRTGLSEPRDLRAQVVFMVVSFDEGWMEVCPSGRGRESATRRDARRRRTPRGPLKRDRGAARTRPSAGQSPPLRRSAGGGSSGAEGRGPRSDPQNGERRTGGESWVDHVHHRGPPFVFGRGE